MVGLAGILNPPASRGLAHLDAHLSPAPSAFLGFLCNIAITSYLAELLGSSMETMCALPFPIVQD